MVKEEYTVSQKELIAFKKRRYSRLVARNAVLRGEIVPDEICHLCRNKTKLQAHHVDYGKPLDLLWLCQSCHGKVHCREHPLNPNNNPQSPMPHVCERYDAVTVTFNIPLKNFLALKAQADEQGKTIAKFMREQVIESCPLQDPQLEFKFEEIKNDKPRKVQDERVRILAEDQDLLQQPERTSLPKIWGARNKSVPRVGEKFFNIPKGRGRDTARL